MRSQATKKRESINQGFKLTMQTRNPADQPNDTWHINLLGPIQTKDGKSCYALVIIDDFSSFIISCRAVPDIDCDTITRHCKNVFRKYGKPLVIHTPEKEPFTSTEAGSLTQLSAWLLKLGIRIERTNSEPSPEKTKINDLHNTLTHETIQPVQLNHRAQQISFTKFTREYNCIHPSKALNNKLPRELYTASQRLLTRSIPSIHYSNPYETRKLDTKGCVDCSGNLIYINKSLADETIGACRISDQRWIMCFGPVHLGTFDSHTNTFKPTQSLKYISDHLSIAHLATLDLETSADISETVHPVVTQSQEESIDTETIRNEICSLLNSRSPNKLDTFTKCKM